MTDSQGQWPPQYPQQGGQPWQGQQYDPDAHQQRLGPPGPQPWPQQGPPSQGYGQPRYPPPPPQYGPPPGWGPGPQQPYPPQGPPGPRRKSWPARHKVLAGLIAAGVIALIGAIASAPAGTLKPAAAAVAAPAPSAASSPVPARKLHAAKHHAPKSKMPAAKAEAACESRGFASGDIITRWRDPGVPWTAQELGGEWTWNSVLRKCLTSAQMMIAASPPGAGNCTQVGYVADNSGYDVNAVPARPLASVAAQAGPAC